MNIVFLDTKTMGAIPNLKIIETYGDVTYYQTTSPEQTAERVLKADIVITNKVVLDRVIIGQAAQLKLICVAATGTNNIDKAAAKEREILVTNATDYSTQSVAQGTFAILLQLLVRVPYFDQYVKEGSYARTDIFTHFGHEFWELNGKRFGIIGLGAIGRQVAKIADAFGCEVVYYSTSGQNTQQAYRRLELDEFLQTSDIVSIHAPLNENTLDLLNYDHLKQMKQSAMLINVGRGGIVNEADLARALDENLIAGAGIDVFTKEPILPESPLLHLKNKDSLVLTPHVTWASLEARTLLMEKIGQTIEEFISII